VGAKGRFMASESGAGIRVTRLGRYEVMSELGKGAMGVVYLARDPVIGRLVALKTIRPSPAGQDDSESREFRERFLREAQTAGVLSHPNIVTIHDVGEDPDTRTSFIAMEYIEGKNLKTLLLEKTPFSFDQVADIVGQVAEALDYAHRKGIIHRDIKPANIVITTDGKVKITDFGIAKVASSNLTTTGQFLGTPNYMSPEQVSGAPVDGRSDIFSLGVVLYELLTRRKPFQGENLTTISYKIVHEPFVPPAEIQQGIPPEFNGIVAKAMAKDPWNRYQRGKDFALALYETKARFEEEKMLRDLGTMVAAAENLPTLKMANLSELAKQGAPPPAAEPAPIAEPEFELETSGARKSAAKKRPAALAPSEATSAPEEPFSGIEEPTSPRASKKKVPSFPVAKDLDPSERPTAAPPVSFSPPPVHTTEAMEARTEIIPIDQVMSASMRMAPPPEPPLPSAVPAPSPTGRPEAPPAVAKSAPPAEAKTPSRKKAARSSAAPPKADEPPPPTGERPSSPATGSNASPVDTQPSGLVVAPTPSPFSVWKAEINPRYFWGIVGGAVAVLLVVVAAILSRLPSGPEAQENRVAVAQVAERRRLLDEGKKFFDAGRYEESLEDFRKVLAANPTNATARHYSQLAEQSLRSQESTARQQTEIAGHLKAGQEALASGDSAAAIREADAVLAVDNGNQDAQSLKKEAAAGERKARYQRERLEARARRKAAASRRAASPPKRAEAPAAAPPEAAPQTPARTASATAPARIRLVFESPISEGFVMVAVNDQIKLREPFNFTKKVGLFKTVKSGGTVTGEMTIAPGPVSLKIWLSTPDASAKGYQTLTGRIGGGETRILRLEYASGRLTAHLQ
jgi:serine/threonine protein kinase